MNLNRMNGGFMLHVNTTGVKRQIRVWQLDYVQIELISIFYSYTRSMREQPFPNLRDNAKLDSNIRDVILSRYITSL